jgi:hypothetical protein
VEYGVASNFSQTQVIRRVLKNDPIVIGRFLYFDANLPLEKITFFRKKMVALRYIENIVKKRPNIGRPMDLYNK